MRKLLLCAALLLGAQAAVAADPSAGYYAIGYTFGQIKAEGVSLDVGDLNGALGWTPVKWLALEVSGVLGVSDATIDGASVKLDSGYMVSVLPTLPLNDDWSVYAKVGYASATIKVSGYGADLSGSDHDTAYGVGLAYTPRFGDYRFGGRLEWMQYYDKDGLKIEGVTLQFMQRF